MKNFRITDGDLDLAHSQRVDMVLGRDKLGQDLTLWLLEPIGTGFATPGFGSTLNSITIGANGRREGRFIGRKFAAGMVVEIEAEIDRVLSLYQQNQVQKIRQARSEGRLYLYRRQEILDSIDSIQGVRDGEVAHVVIDITTGSGNLDLLAQIDEEEVSIAAQG